MCLTVHSSEAYAVHWFLGYSRGCETITTDFNVLLPSQKETLSIHGHVCSFPSVPSNQLQWFFKIHPRYSHFHSRISCHCCLVVSPFIYLFVGLFLPADGHLGWVLFFFFDKERDKESPHPFIYFWNACGNLSQAGAWARNWTHNPGLLSGSQEPKCLSHRHWAPGSALAVVRTKHGTQALCYGIWASARPNTRPCFHLLAVVNNAVTEISVQSFVYLSFHFFRVYI